MIERLVFKTILLLKLCIFLPAEITISAHQNPPSLQACPKCYLFNETPPHLLKLKLYFSSFQLLCCLDQWWTNYGPQAKSVSLCLIGTWPCSFTCYLQLLSCCNGLKLSSCDRDRKAQKAKNIYYLAFYIKSFLTPDLDDADQGNTNFYN